MTVRFPTCTSMCVAKGVYTIYVYAGRERENERIWREREGEGEREREREGEEERESVQGHQFLLVTILQAMCLCTQLVSHNQ